MINKIRFEMHPKLYFPLLLFVFLLLTSHTCFSQYNETDSATIEKLRTQSGIDPTRIQSRVGYTFLTRDMAKSAGVITNRANMTLGVSRWSFVMKYEAVTVASGIPGSGFESGFGDIRFNVLNAFYVKGKHALAVNAEFSMPTGGTKYGFGYYTVTPALTYSYTIKPSLFFAIQPQYTFALMKDPLYPSLSILTIRSFLAKFTKTGYFFVFEPRPIFDFENKTTDFIISPIIGKSLGGGFNFIVLMEYPTNQSTRDNFGVTYQFGFNKNF